MARGEREPIKGHERLRPQGGGIDDWEKRHIVGGDHKAGETRLGLRRVVTVFRRTRRTHLGKVTLDKLLAGAGVPS